MNYVSAHSPKWRTRTSVNLIVLFEGHDAEIPFVAHIDDTDEYNRELFNRAINGEFGEIDNARKSIFDQVKLEIIKKRDYLMFQGGCKLDNHWFHSDTHSKLQQLSLMIAGSQLPAGLMWKTMNGDKVEMTPALAAMLYQAQMVQEQYIFGTAEYLISQAEQMEFPELLDIESGWPEVFTK